MRFSWAEAPMVGVAYGLGYGHGHELLDTVVQALVFTALYVLIMLVFGFVADHVSWA